MKERTPYLFLNQLAILFTQASTRSQWLGSSKTGVIHFVKKKKKMGMWVVNGLLQTATDAIQREKWITVKRGQRSHTSLMVKGDSHQAGKASEMENLKSEYLFMNRTERRAANSCEEGGK